MFVKQALHVLFTWCVGLTKFQRFGRQVSTSERRGRERQARSVLYAYTLVRTLSDQKILKFMAIVSIFNSLLVLNQDFVMKTSL